MFGEGDESDVDIKLGSHQIEYEDEDPMVRKLYEEACTKAGIKSQMEKYHNQA